MAADDEILLQTDDVRVRVMTLSPGTATTWHRHSEVTDHMVGLEGRLTVMLRDPDEELELVPGRRCCVPVGRTHRVVNATREPARYLLAQGVGRYDFLPAAE